MEEQLLLPFDKYSMTPWEHVEQWWVKKFLYLKRNNQIGIWESLAVCINDEEHWNNSVYKLQLNIYRDSYARKYEHSLKTLSEVMKYADSLLPDIKWTGFVKK